MKKFLIIYCFLLFFLTSISAQSHWESIILFSDQWRYFPAVSEPPADWNTADFIDTTWNTGPGGFGYGDGDDATLLLDAVNSVYLRIKFQVDDTSVLEQVLLDIDYDDAFVAYLNGTEFARSFNITDDTPVYNSSLTTDHEAKMYRGIQPDRFPFPHNTILIGENTLAVQIINNGISSSDLTGIVFLNALIDYPSVIYNPVPDWFREPYTFGESNLPLIIINTIGQEIPDEPKINVQMGIIDNPGGVNKITDPFNDYDGIIGIEIRGSSSQSFEKKNYGFETRLEDGTNNNVSLLGLPAENDWILHGPYSDKSLMRNALAYHLGNQMGRWNPHTRFCELYINDDYQGVYVLIEKIKRDDNRLDIAALNPGEITGSDLTGGYILSIDRASDHYWISPFKGSNYIGEIVINYVYPEYDSMPAEQRNYIRYYVTYFENALFSGDYQDPAKGYRAYADPASYIDYFLISELSRNVDAYRLSTFFYKDKDGKLTMGPLWDFDLAFGNANYYEASEIQGWMIYTVDTWDSYQTPLWWDKLREDDYFNAEMKLRWEELRNGPFHLDSIFAYIDSASVLLADAQERNFYRFPILGIYVWPNYFVGDTYEEEIGFLKEWISQRILWIDGQIALIIPDENVPLANAYETYAFPNPFVKKVSIRIKLYDSADVTVSIYDMLGRLIFSDEQHCPPGLNDFIIPESTFDDQAGIYIYEIRLNGEKFLSGKMVKYQ
jgi:hypothetical protein